MALIPLLTKGNKMPKKVMKKSPVNIKQSVDIIECIYKGSMEHIPLFIYLTTGGADDADSSLYEDKIEMHIGVHCSFKDVVESIIHELDELYLLIKGCRFYDSNKDERFEAIECVFMFNHTQLQMKDFCISDILTDIFVNTANTWHKYNKEKKTEFVKEPPPKKKNIK